MEGSRKLAKSMLLIFLVVVGFVFFIYMTIWSTSWSLFWDLIIFFIVTVLVVFIYYYQNKSVPVLGSMFYCTLKRFLKYHKNNKIQLSKNVYGRNEVFIDVDMFGDFLMICWPALRRAVLIFSNVDDIVKMVFDDSKPLGLLPAKHFQRLYDFERIKEEYFNEYLGALRSRQKRARALSAMSFVVLICCVFIFSILSSFYLKNL